jgi:hypothetical protein
MPREPEGRCARRRVRRGPCRLRQRDARGQRAPDTHTVGFARRKPQPVAEPFALAVTEPHPARGPGVGRDVGDLHRPARGP